VARYSPGLLVTCYLTVTRLPISCIRDETGIEPGRFQLHRVF